MRNPCFATSVALLLLLVMLAACKKNGSNNPIAGTWGLASYYSTTYTNGILSMTYDTSYASAHSIETTFNGNGTYTSTDYLDSPVTTSTGSYSTAVAGKLTTYSNTIVNVPQTVIYAISGNVMTITESTGNSSVGASTSIKENYYRQ